jgi:hypothetical protein
MTWQCSCFYFKKKCLLVVVVGAGACTLFVWLISHQPAVLFSQNKPAISNQPAVLFSQNKSAPAISHQPNEQAVGFHVAIALPIMMILLPETMASYDVLIIEWCAV